MKRTTPRLLAACLVIALGASGPGTYLADARVIDGVVTQQSPSTIDATRLVNLTIRKAKPNPFDDVPGTGLPLAPVEGVTFTVHRVNGIDMTTQEGWDLAHTLTPEEAVNRGLGDPVSAVTDSEGKAYFPGLPVGLYYVTETHPDIPGYRYYTAAPFLITLPTGDIDGVSWDYEVVITSKGTPDGVPPTDPELPPTDPVFPPGTTTPTTRPTTPRPTTTPQVPVRPGQPGQPGQPGGGAPASPARSGPLASTGASVLGLVTLGLFLIAGGVLLARRRGEQ